MSVSREDFFTAIKDLDDSSFITLIQKHHCKDDSFDLPDFLSALDKKHVEEVWDCLLMKLSGAVLSCDVDHSSTQQAKEFEHAALVIQGIVTVTMVMTSLNDMALPQPLFETVVLLHGLLPSLSEASDKLCNAISKVLEAWWHNHLTGREAVCTNALLYVLGRSLEPKAAMADVKRVWQLHDFLLLVDLSADKTNRLRALLQQAVVSVNFLKSDEGRRFLAHLLGLNALFTETIHRTIKNHLPNAPRSVMTWYGEIYFRAWRVASGDILQVLEEGCIQDFMYHAIHSQKLVATLLRKLLGYFHKQKKQQGVDEMLLRLYDPIMWRSLKVANGLVRSNAAELFVDVFPLQNPEAGVEDFDELLQKQFSTFSTLLTDPYPRVRVVSVEGVCKICNLFWEMIPPATLKGFLGLLVQDMAWDGSSVDVRVAVLTGMAHLLDNFLSHSVLKSLLPELKSLFHDNSEKVRVAYVDLLLKAKGVKAIKFWNLIPLDHLLERLSTDTHQVARRLVALLYNSYMPVEREPEVQVTRCISLIESNHGAARRFYQYAVRHVSLSNTVKFLLMLCKGIMGAVRRQRLLREPGATESPARDILASSDEDEEENQSRPQRHAPPAAAAGSDVTTNGMTDAISVDNVTLMAGLLETVAILWMGISPKLEAKANKELKRKLLVVFSRSLPELFRASQDQSVLSPLLLLAGFMSPEMLPTLSQSLLSKLKGLTAEDGDALAYGPVLDTLCRWGKAADVLDLITEWLEAGLLGQSTPQPHAKAARRVGFVDPVDPQPQLALSYLAYLTRVASCRECLLASHAQALGDIAKQLKAVLPCIKKRLESGESLGLQCGDHFLVQALEAYLKLEVLLQDSDDDPRAVTVLHSLLTWGQSHLLPALNPHNKPRPLTQSQPRRKKLLSSQDMTMTDPSDTISQTMSQTMSQTIMESPSYEDILSTTLLGGGKRPARRDSPDGTRELAIKLIQCLFQVASNMLMVGIGDMDLVGHLTDFTLAFLQIGEDFQMSSAISLLIYQVTEMTLTFRPIANQEPSCHDNVVPEMMSKTMEMLTLLLKSNKEETAKALQSLKPVFHKALRAQTFSGRPPTQDPLLPLVTAAVADLTDAVKQDNDLDVKESVSELPVLSGFVLGLVWRKSSLLSEFLKRLARCLQSEAVGDVEHFLAVTFLLVLICKGVPGRDAVGDAKECVLSLEGRVERLAEGGPGEGDMEDSPRRQMLTRCKDLISKTKQSLNMVA